MNCRLLCVSIYLLLLGHFDGSAQTKEILLEDIWKKFAFSSKSVPGFTFMNDGKHYTTLKDGVIEKYDFTSGLKVGDLFNGPAFAGTDAFNGKMDGYSFHTDESKIMLTSETESIYRRSSKEFVHVYNFATDALVGVRPNQKIMYATLSPDGTKVAYVFQNDIYYQDLKSGKTTRVTTDGKVNAIINGGADWVYEEEFSITKFFFWSPDSKKISYLKFDETEVPEYSMEYHTDQTYPEIYKFKYPKVGEKNAKVKPFIYTLASKKSVPVDMANLNDMYIPRMKWTPTNQLVIYKMNRHQNHLQLFITTDAVKGKTKLLFEEKNKYYIDITDDLTFIKGGSQFIWTSEKNGYQQIFLYDSNGKEVQNLTPGKYDVRTLYGVDEVKEVLYYSSAEVSPLETHIYTVKLDGTAKKKITELPGTNEAQFSSTYDYYVLTHSTANIAPTYTVYDRNQNKIRVIEDNSRFTNHQKEYGLNPVEFFTFKTSEDVTLNGYMIKPANFNESRRYPVFMTQYSGPGSQQVVDKWGGTNYFWHQMLAQQGYLVVCVDPRGTGARGEEFKKMTYLQLGHYEVIDQIESAKYIGQLPYVDSSRIGIFGWSYGGHMSSLCILKGNDTFKAAIAVAPVTSWKWYDTIYTERYMKTYAENKKGYDDNSPVYFADRLKGKYLLVHGITDDNVHWQNSAEMMNALINANKQYETYVYPNKNHGIYGGNARIHLYTKVTNFIYNNI